MSDEKIPVIIFGQTYEIVGSALDSLYYNSLARYVEEKMREVQENTNVISTQKVAILAALNIADELFSEKEGKFSSMKLSEKKIDEMLSILEEALKNSPVSTLSSSASASASTSSSSSAKKEKFSAAASISKLEKITESEPKKSASHSHKHTEEPTFDFLK